MRTSTRSACWISSTRRHVGPGRGAQAPSRHLRLLGRGARDRARATCVRRRLVGARRARPAAPRHDGGPRLAGGRASAVRSPRPRAGRPPGRRAARRAPDRRRQLSGPTGGRPFSAKPAGQLLAVVVGQEARSEARCVSSGRHQTGSSQTQAFGAQADLGHLAGRRLRQATAETRT